MKRNATWNERKMSLLRLQRDYIKDCISVLDGMLVLTDDLKGKQDPAIIEKALKQLDELEAMVNDNQEIAEKIKEKYEHLCRQQQSPSSGS